MRRALTMLLRQPLVQFVLIGALIFAAWKVANPEAEAAPTEIRVGASELKWLHDTWIGQFGHPPDATEMASAVRGYVDEEMRYREGLALGLDADDTIVRRRLAQKYDFMLGAQAADMIPTDAQLSAFLARHAERYRLPAKTSFCQVWFGDGATGFAAAKAALSGLSGSAIRDPDARLAGRDGLPFERCYPAAVPVDVSRDFGVNFATVIDRRLPVGAWQGPVESGFGFHLVIVTRREPGAPGTVAAMRPQLEADWRAQAMVDAKARQEADLRRRYRVIVDQAALRNLVGDAPR